MGLFGPGSEQDNIAQMSLDMLEIISEIKKQQKTLTMLLEHRTRDIKEIKALLAESSTTENRLIALESKMEVLIGQGGIEIHNISGKVDGDVKIAGGDQNG